MDLHLIILIAIMLVLGGFGGFLNYLNDFDTLENEQKSGRSRSKYILLGIGAALLIPLFLKMIESNIIRSRDNLDYLIFAGFCLIAAIFSRRFISSLGDRIMEVAKKAQKAATESKIKAEEAQKELLATQERIEDVKLAVHLNRIGEVTLQDDEGQGLEELVSLATTYVEKTRVPEYGERVKLKAETGRRMGELILRHGMDKEMLLREHLSEGMIVALAYAVHLRPMGGDAALLLRAAEHAEQLHTRFALLMGIDALARNHCFSPEQIKVASTVLDGYKKNADDSLRSKIADTQRILALV
jgi:hypothetical protein